MGVEQTPPTSAPLSPASFLTNFASRIVSLKKILPFCSDHQLALVCRLFSPSSLGITLILPGCLRFSTAAVVCLCSVA